MPLRSCRVSFTDTNGIRHSADVVAESMFEAAVLGVQVLRRDGWVDAVIRGATRLEVEVREASATHAVTLTQIERWLTGATPSPAERVKKDRLRALLRAAAVPGKSRR